MIELQRDPAHPGQIRLVHRASLEDCFLLELAVLTAGGDAQRVRALRDAFEAERRAMVAFIRDELRRRAERVSARRRGFIDRRRPRA